MRFSKGKRAVKKAYRWYLLITGVGLTGLGVLFTGLQNGMSQLQSLSVLQQVPIVSDLLPSEAHKQGDMGILSQPNETGYSFTESQWSAKTGTQVYSPLDDLGRVGSAFAVIGQDTMPTTKRESIGMVKPTGWHTVRYDNVIADKYLYNRCHLIAFMLSGQNANELNLMTGTRQFNVEGMLPFENQVADYVRRTNHHVLYKVTPDFRGSELVARGVTMEAYSLEDDGCRFNVYVHNTQKGIVINYQTGESALE